MSRTPLPWSLHQNPILSQWVDFSEPGVARVFSAKVELGQGILTALTQIAAEELRLPMPQIVLVSGDTRFCPNESYTAGSMSIEIGGTALRMACAQAREAMLDRAGRMLEANPDDLTIDAGRFLVDGERSGLDYWEVAHHIDWQQPVTGAVPLTSPEKVIGTSAERLDLSAKVSGAAFIHDLEMPGMLHARVLRPPSYGVRLESFDPSRTRNLPGVALVWRSGDFVGVCCEKEYQAVKALEALRADARWSAAAGSGGDPDWREILPTLNSFDSETERGSRAESDRPGRRLSATYSRPPIAHASMAPSCAIALYDGTRMTVWTHSQGVFPLRDALAGALGLEPGQIDVIHRQGAGVYGHNAADDAAFDAAVLARQLPTRPVRVQWAREDEMAWSPLASPMVVKLDAELAPNGAIREIETQIWSGPHGKRPLSRDAVNLLGASHLDPPIPIVHSHEMLSGFAGGARNSELAYDAAYHKTILHSLPDLPFRTSALRSLGGFANVFAIECFIDELADASGTDPVDFRLRHLKDPRARKVVEVAARLAGWPGAPYREGEALGIGFSRYKNTAAYVAVVARIAVAEVVSVRNAWCAADAGLVINPDGAINQIEGGIIQSISWTLKEHATFEAGGKQVTSRSWESYPILRFTEVPEVRVELISSSGSPPLGVGEASVGPTGAAVANAVSRALGVRIRDLPLTRERIITRGGG